MVGEATFRVGVMEVLELLSSSKKQFEYADRLPNISILTELVCLWFDDIYIPDNSFKQCFSEEELAAMAAFNTYFEKQYKLLPDHVGIPELLKNENWQQIMGQARQTLAILRREKL
jgi:hypothetical protein